MAWKCWGMVVAGVVALTSAASGINENTTIVLHAQPWPAYGCYEWVGIFDCSPSSPPTTQVEPGAEITVYVLLRNYERVNALLCRFSIGGGTGPATWGDWTIHFGLFESQPNQISSAQPSPWFPGGDDPGDLVTVFDCLTGGFLEPLGRMRFDTGTWGCLEVGDISWPGAAVVWDCQGGSTAIPLENRGSVCINASGNNACDPAVPVEPATWGKIKDQYLSE